MRHVGLAAAGFALALGTAAPSASSAQENFITIGTGGQTGVYYVVGQSVCKLVNRSTDLKCTAPSTGGSVANVNAIISGDQDLAVAQSDVQYKAFHGEDPWAGQAYDKLRSVFAVHPEPITVVARADAGIKTFDDLKGKRVNVGNPGSGTRETLEAIMSAKGWTMADFSLASELKSAEQAAALCDNKVDAIFFAVGHPAGTIQEATTACDSVLVPITGPEIDQLVEQNPYYTKATIAGGLYQGNPEPTDTFGVRATFVTSADVPEDVIYSVTKSVFDNFDRFKGLHPAFEILEPQDMVTSGLSAPLHPGAERYFREQGWLPAS
jgi:TRAP transporter TAXI family solute receptor